MSIVLCYLRFDCYVEVSSVVVFDANTLEILHSHELGKNELAMSIKSCVLGDDPQPYYAVGTAVVLTDETESKSVHIYYLALVPIFCLDILCK